MDTHGNLPANKFDLNELLGPFSSLEDPRSSNATRHLFDEILFISLTAIICGAEGFTDMERFGKAKQHWLESFLTLPNGIPSHDAFGDLYAKLDPEAFNAAFIEWIAPLRQHIESEVVSLDGKSARGSHDRLHANPMVHTVSAWATQNKLVLGQLCVADKSNEITAIPKLLELLSIEGCIVTIDAMGTQKNIAAKIVEKKADYLLALKDNHKTFHQEVIELFADKDTMESLAAEGRRLEHDETHESGHGRLETRRCTVIEAIDWYRESWQWANLRSLVMVESIRQCGEDEPSVERRYYLSSLPADARLVAAAARAHWGIENSLHWVLDVTLHEDASRIRSGNAPKNLTLARKFALNLLQKAPGQDSIKGKQRMAGWNHDYLVKILKS